MKVAFLLAALFVSVFLFIFFTPVNNQTLVSQVAETLTEKPLPPLPELDEVKAIYITAAIARSERMEEIIKLIKRTELNAVVIDVKDENGDQLDSQIKTLVKRLRFLNIFPIARLTVFQDNGLAQKHPELAVKKSDGSLWQDRGRRYWLDPASSGVWGYILETAREVAEAGFGEINFDYIRFPSDGDLDAMVYPIWDGKEKKTDVITNFSKYLKYNLKKEFPDLKLTADLFGYTFLRAYDLGIGQSIIELSQVFDEICPMVYPSHYDSGNFNFENPADHPYEVVYETLKKGKEIFDKQQIPFVNIRPWIQDFNLGAIYTPEMVRAQMKAIEDVGLKRGWMIWNPNNKYREAIFETSN